MSRALQSVACVTAFVAGVALARAGEGPSTWSAPLRVEGGDLLKKNAYELSLRTTLTRFDALSRTEAESHAGASGAFTSLDHAILQTCTLAFGASDDFECAASIGYVFGSNLLSARSATGAGVTSTDADPDGLTDLWLDGKYRLASDGRDRVAARFGLSVPVGEEGQSFDDGSRIGAADQPGTGAFGYRVGLGWTRVLSAGLACDASALYTGHAEHEDARLGDRADAGLALAWRPDTDARLPHVTVALAAHAVWMDRDRIGDADDRHSGGHALYLSPELRVRTDAHVSFGLAPQFPVLEERRGDQVETDWKLAFEMRVSF